MIKTLFFSGVDQEFCGRSGSVDICYNLCTVSGKYDGRIEWMVGIG